MDRRSWFTSFLGSGTNGAYETHDQSHEKVQKSGTLQPGTTEFSDLRSMTTPTRWHPEYEFQNGVSTYPGHHHPKPLRPAPPKSPVSISVTPFLSTIHEDMPDPYHHHRHSDTEPPRLLGNGLYLDIPRRRSEGDLSSNGSDKGRYLKRRQKDSEDRKTSQRGSSNGEIPDLPNDSSTGLLAVPARAKKPNSNGDSGIETDSRSDRSFRSSKTPSRSDRVTRSSTRSEPDYLSRQRRSGQPAMVRNGGFDRSSLRRGSERRESTHSARLSQSRRARSDTNLSLAGRSSVGSQRPSTIDIIAGSSVSAEMVSENPTLAASRAFASIEIPVDLLDSSSKRLKKVCGPAIMCGLIIILAASLGAAVYFAVVLNNTQGNEIAFLRATLRLQLEQSSADKLTNLTVTEAAQFKEQYCKEIDAYYRRSTLSDTYEGCEVASVQDDEIRLVLYFDSKRRQTQNEASEDAILQVLASSAPRVGQEEDGVVSINNVQVKLASASVAVEETKEVPEFLKSGIETTAASANIIQISSVPQSSKPTTETVTVGSKTSANFRTSTGVQLTDPYRPCGPGESRTYYRYPNSCSLFFQCLDGRSITMSCGKNMVFNMTSLVCVTEVSDCVEPTDADLGVEPELLHPCEAKGGVYYPHPLACNLFIHCDNFNSFVRICPDGLVFDTATEECKHLSEDFVCPADVALNKKNSTNNQTLERTFESQQIFVTNSLERPLDPELVFHSKSLDSQ